jgi:hypothetical protein
MWSTKVTITKLNSNCTITHTYNTFWPTSTIIIIIITSGTVIGLGTELSAYDNDKTYSFWLPYFE